MADRQLIGREREQARLAKMLEAPEAEFLALYGRRRVGKTFLIRQFFAEQIVFDFSGTRTGNKLTQLRNFHAVYAAYTSGKRESVEPKSWQEAFHRLAGYLQSLPNTSAKRVVFLDEMPWMDTPKSEFIPALEFFWNQYGSRMDNLILVACGSATSWVRKHLLKARGGLYNRVTQRMRLHPFNLHETERYLDARGIRLSRYQILEVYMALGGIPFYLKELEKGFSSVQQIEALCFQKDGALFDEYEQLYFSLFKNAEVHTAIIELLASHPQGMTRAKIATNTGLPNSVLFRAMEELIECDFVEIQLPFLNKKKEATYKLIDFYSLFYLKFVKDRKADRAKTWVELSKLPVWKAWSGYAFENIWMQHIPQIKQALGIQNVSTTHSSWHFRGNDDLPGAQIDLVIERADHIIHLCEAKFTKDSYVLPQDEAIRLRQRQSIFQAVTKTHKTVHTTLLTTYPSLKNAHYMSLIDQEVGMDALFQP